MVMNDLFNSSICNQIENYLMNATNITSDVCFSFSLCEETEFFSAQEISPHCFPEFLQNWRYIFITNILLILTIGGLGNILTLCAVPYCLYINPRYKNEFPGLGRDALTVLMLHLSFCDLLYNIIGLPPVLYIYFTESLPFSGNLCSILATIRNLIAYADLNTLAFIAVQRMIETYKIIQKLKNSPNAEYSPQCLENIGWLQSIMLCLSTWLLSFIIISPIMFNMEFWGITWGKYAFNQMYSFCATVNKPTGKVSPSGLIYSIGFFFPFITLNLSYIFLWIICRNSWRSEWEGQVPRHFREHIENLQVTLILLCGSYLIFCGPLVPVQWIDVLIKDKYNRIMYTVLGFAWYWWIYAINFLVYMFKFKAFRKMYKIFLKDLVQLLKYLLVKENIERRDMIEMLNWGKGGLS